MFGGRVVLNETCACMQVQVSEEHIETTNFQIKYSLRVTGGLDMPSTIVSDYSTTDSY